MNFKQFLKEDPDISKGASYSDNDSITVTLFKNYYLYAPTSVYTHEQMFLNLYLNNVKDQDLNLLSEQKRDFIKYLVSVVREAFPHIINSFGVFHSSYKKKLIAEFNKTIEYGYSLDLLKDRITNDGILLQRDELIRYFPNVLLCRYWKDKKIVSFWNVSSVVSGMKSDVYSFLKKLGVNIGEVRYEVGDNMVDYSAFESGRYSSGILDVSKVHTLSPESKGDVLRRMGVVPRQPVDIRSKYNLGSE